MLEKTTGILMDSKVTRKLLLGFEHSKKRQKLSKK